MSFNGWIAGAFIGGIWNVMVIFGLQWAVNPVMIQNISVLGFDKIVPLTGAANFGMAGAAMGTFLKTKDSEMKSFSFSALLSIFFAGITEPAIYGIAVKYKKPLIGAVIGGAAGGIYRWYGRECLCICIWRFNNDPCIYWRYVGLLLNWLSNLFRGWNNRDDYSWY